ncbi:fibrosin-1 protein [Elysia marginata]|uniref:Fibrosin-1 protein n=1 Tax=Elysia marginata TaxID=1093978 RepID=A0AAV4IUA8_9GAST|nr:fibrosin-1 protein [Elysia marginata]
MEADSGKQRSRQKRRERALLLQQEKQTKEEEEEEGASGQDDHGESPPRSSKDKTRLKPKKNKSALFEEDIIDGFAIISFKTLEDLEKSSATLVEISFPTPNSQSVAMSSTLASRY